MSQIATITSKRQLTIPSKIFKKAGFKKGDRVIVNEEDGELRIKRAVDLIEELAGSVEIPEEFKGVDIDDAIKIAKEKHFSKKREQ